ncbi:MAG TPA: oligosaccharide flippase family protein [Polyangiales bacterium]|nr:oligosaccharide flippase family protein [Polyangiales bacterium]
MASTDTASTPPKQGLSTLVLRNALVLVVAQVAVIPLALLMNAVMGRYLGPANFGAFYLVSTYVGTAFLLIEWGQGNTLPALIAKQRERAAVFLGSALAFRAIAVPVVFLLVGTGCWLLGYTENFELLLAMFFVAMAIASAALACQDASRGFERTDIVAYATVGTQLLMVVLIVPTVLLGGQLPAVVMATACANLIVLVLVWRGVRTMGLTRLSVDRSVLKQLVSDGVPFFFFALTLRLQPNIDALYLSRLAPEEVVGWYAAAEKLKGVLVFPASALVSALYPTMCRLFVSDSEGYRRTAQTAIEISALAVVPVAIGAYLYADLGIAIYSKQAYGPAADNLRMLAPFIFMVYISMPLGACILAAGRSRIWTSVQALCIVISLVFDPLLIPWFQQRTGNGGLGVCAAVVLAELMMVIAGVVLMPKGVFDRQLLLGLARLGVAGGAMFGVGHLLSGISPFLAAPIAVLTYLATLRAIGGLKADQLQLFKDIVSRKAKRAPAPPQA